ncbi:metalloregulator ArsR/SmtB family transcription factor [Aliisedimentitalea scapharcae]|uniref:Metalloregulator ArsR/SmtB family transcription factor n=1 Tax=Aliisedimentitalea scapharcae TaxID=1524259 RepID=A0ABZ2XS89_9RHOB|nr:metalloregulator ArsR/SmtB family transcription factor [Rhodobacteraceae bacterium M382]
MSDMAQMAFRALSDPSRRDILYMLGDRDLTVAEVSAQFDMTRAAVKKHLVVLEEGGLIRSYPRGRERINSLHPEGLRPVLNWLVWFDQFWDDKLSGLKATIEQKGLSDD